MIWNSATLMTIVDILIIAGVGWCFVTFLRNRMRSGNAASMFATRLTMAGFTLIALYCFSDLVTMHVLPFLVPKEDAMTAKEFLHIEAAWFVMLIALGFLILGFGLSVKSDFSFVHDLLTSRNKLNQEIEARAQAHGTLRESEARFRDLVESMSDWIWETGPDFRFNWVSSSVETVFGLPATHFIGRSLKDLDAPDEKIENLEQHLGDFHAHRPFENLISKRKLRDGKVIHLAMSGKPLFGADGVFMGYRGIGRDISAYTSLH